MGRYKRVTMAMTMMMKAAPGPPRNCESSGSEHFPSDQDDDSSSSPGDLSDLVNSYIERDLCLSGVEGSKPELEDDREDGEDININGGAELDETRDVLEGLLRHDDDDDDDDEERARIREAVESILVEDRNSLSLHQQQKEGFNFKRRLMSRLRHRGFDAGICKSRWAKSGRHPAGDYEYVDVNVKKHRYIVEVNLSMEFDIARATTSYSSLLGLFPVVYVARPEDMKQVLRLMSRGIRVSMKTTGLKVPPWRRYSYMQSKWLGPYKRTTNEVPASKSLEVVRNRSLSNGFEVVLPVRASNQGKCKDEFKGNDGFKVGLLAALLGGDVIDI